MLRSRLKRNSAAHFKSHTTDKDPDPEQMQNHSVLSTTTSKCVSFVLAVRDTRPVRLPPPRQRCRRHFSRCQDVYFQPTTAIKPPAAASSSLSLCLSVCLECEVRRTPPRQTQVLPLLSLFHRVCKEPATLSTTSTCHKQCHRSNVPFRKSEKSQNVG